MENGNKTTLLLFYTSSLILICFLTCTAMHIDCNNNNIWASIILKYPISCYTYAAIMNVGFNKSFKLHISIQTEIMYIALIILVHLVCFYTQHKLCIGFNKPSIPHIYFYTWISYSSSSLFYFWLILDACHGSEWNDVSTMCVTLKYLNWLHMCVTSCDSENLNIRGCFIS